MILRIEVAFFLFILISACQTSTIEQPVADLIITNANIITVDSSFSSASAMAIKNGKIIGIGQEVTIDKTRGQSTRVIDLMGMTVLPGFIEPHTHPIAGAALYDWIDVSGMKHSTAKGAIRALQKAARQVPEGEWIVAFGWDMILLEDAFPLTADYLDRTISNKHPIWVMAQSMHTHYMNTLAMKKAGINKNTSDPPGGGHYLKDSKGQLTGIATESATVAPLLMSLPLKSRQDVRRAIERMYSRYNAAGITSIGVTGMIDMFAGHNALDICEEIARESFAPLRVYHYNIGGPKQSDSLPQNQSEYLTRLGQKYWIDGSPYTGSMLMTKPYESNSFTQEKLNIPEGSSGHLMYPESVYRKIFEQVHKLGWQLSVHCQGDSAVSVALNSLRRISIEENFHKRRHRLEHLALVTDDQLQEMNLFGLTPSFHINHIYYYGDALSSYIIGQDRTNKMMPLASAIRFDHKLSLHSDSPMYPPNPLLTVKTAVTRQSSSGTVYGPDQRISVADAIRAVTIHAAWQMHADNQIGSLEVGKKADFIILEEDPTTVLPERIDHIRIIATFINGQKAI